MSRLFFITFLVFLIASTGYGHGPDNDHHHHPGRLVPVSVSEMRLSPLPEEQKERPRRQRPLPERVENLEKVVIRLLNENSKLQSDIRRLRERIQDLEDEMNSIPTYPPDEVSLALEDREE